MSPEAQRIAIAEACGWHGWAFGKAWRPGLSQAQINDYYDRQLKGAVTGSAPIVFGGSPIAPEYPPDYLSDINAMHEVVASLPENLRRRFSALLVFEVTGKLLQHVPLDAEDIYAVATATAAQYAVVFLRTVDKWEDA